MAPSPDLCEEEGYGSTPLNERKSNGKSYSECDQTDVQLLRNSSPNNLVNSDQKRFGWFGYQPECLQKLLSAKWALFWICWAGFLQGERVKSGNLNKSIKRWKKNCLQIEKKRNNST